MRIGIDCRYIFNIKNGEVAGVGHYVYFLIKYLLKIDKQNEYILFFYNKNIKFDEFKQSNVKFVNFSNEQSFLGKTPFIYRHIIIPNIIRLHRLDIYHNPANIIPFFYLRKSIITIHDLAIYKNPKWFPDGQFFNRKILIPLSIYKAKKIIAVSESTRNDLISIFKVKKEKIKVVHEGVEDYSQIEINRKKIENKLQLNYPYFLFIGTLEPRKNLVRLIKAFAKFLKEEGNSNFKLLLAGKKGWKYDRIFETIKNLNLDQNVKYLGFVSLQEKIYLLENAYAFVFPTLYEGFGLPIIEAMNVGIPIITSNIASIPELVIDNAILIDDPKDIKSIKKSLIKIVKNKDLRESLINKGKDIAKNFSWDECARKTLILYKSLQNKK